MKPKDYVKKYQGNWDRGEFLRDLAADFSSQVEFHKPKQWSLVVFDNICKQMIDKFRSIQFGIKEANDPNLWNMFQEGVVEPLRDREFGEQLRAEAEMRRAMARQERQQRQAYERMFRGRAQARAATDADFMRILFALMGLREARIPVDDFKTLGIVPESSEEDIKTAFRTLVKIYHPDIPMTGSKDTYLKIAEAKERCLTYVSERDQRGKPQAWAEQAAPSWP